MAGRHGRIGLTVVEERRGGERGDIGRRTAEPLVLACDPARVTFLPGNEERTRAFIGCAIGKAPDMGRNAVLGHLPPDSRRGHLRAKRGGERSLILLAAFGIACCGRDSRQHVP